MGHSRDMDKAPSVEFAQATRRDMLAEAREIIDAARERGIVLRLFGGLAVRTHCAVIAFCERDYADLDMVGLARQGNEIADFMKGLGYSENVLVGQATDGHQRQFYRSLRAQRRRGALLRPPRRSHRRLPRHLQDGSCHPPDRATHAR